MKSKKINHWCIVCGKGYHACNSCDDVKSFTPWKILTDTSNHYSIRLIIDDYTNNVIDKKKAKDMLKKCDLTGYKDFLPHVSKIISDILAYDDHEENTRKLRIKKDNV